MNGTKSTTTSTARRELLDGLCKFAADHGLSANIDDVPTIARKFLVVHSNNTELEKAYPLIADDLTTIKFRVGARHPVYRGKMSRGITYSPAMWSHLFSQSDMSAFAPGRNNSGAADPDLEGFYHFKNHLETRDPDFRALPTWKKALAFYMGTKIFRNEHAVCSDVMGMRHTRFQSIVNQLRPDEKATAVAAMARNMTFERLDDAEFRSALRDPARHILTVQQKQQRLSRGPSESSRSSSRSNPWDAPSKSLDHAPTAAAACALGSNNSPVAWNISDEAQYRSHPTVAKAVAKVGDFAPLHMVFSELLNSADASPSDWHHILKYVDHANVDAVMETPEMQDFIHSVASNVSVSDFSKLTLRDATKKIATIRSNNWPVKWAAEWQLDEPTKRAIAHHLKAYPSQSPALTTAFGKLRLHKAGM